MFELLISGFKKKEQFLNIWSLLEPTSSKPSARRLHTLTSVGNKLYLHGGFTSSRNDDLWEYDVPSNRWLKLNPTGSKPSARNAHTLTSVDDKLYLHGGSTGSGMFNNELWEYNTSSHTWSLLNPTGSKPIGRSGHKLTSIGNKLYLHGGSTSASSNSYNNELWEYDIDDNSWLLLESSGDKPTVRYGHTLTSVDDKLYLHGGSTGGDELWEYDVDSNAWSLLEPSGDKPSGRSNHTLTSVGNKLYLHGGNVGGDELWEYDINDNVWLMLEPIDSKPSARNYHTLTNIRNKLYLHGGNTGGNNGELWEYTIGN